MEWIYAVLNKVAGRIKRPRYKSDYGRYAELKLDKAGIWGCQVSVLRTMEARILMPL